MISRKQYFSCFNFRYSNLLYTSVVVSSLMHHFKEAGLQNLFRTNTYNFLNIARIANAVTITLYSKVTM